MAAREDSARPLSLRPLTRLAGLALIVAGLLTTVELGWRLHGPSGITGTVWGFLLALIGLYTVAVDWERFPRRAVSLPVIGWGALAFGGMLAGHPLPGAAAATVAIACWAGLAVPAGQLALVSPWVLLTTLAPGALSAGGSVPLGDTLAVTVVAVGVGECLAILARRLRAAEASDAARVEALDRLVEASMALSASTTRAEAAAAIVSRAATLSGAARAVLVAAGKHGDEEVGRFGEGPQPTGTALPVRGGGLLLLDVDSVDLDSFALDCLRTLCAQGGLVLERLRATATLQADLDVDPLTGVGNRRRLETALRDIRPADLLVVVDLDHFKQVNDTHGHAAGDAVLVALARHLERSVRDGDVVARLGGEEFVLVLREAGWSLASTGATLARIGASWSRLVSTQPAGLPVTFSAGAAVHTGGDGHSTLDAADAALYRAKGAGRARAVVLGIDRPIPLTAEVTLPSQRPPHARRTARV